MWAFQFIWSLMRTCINNKSTRTRSNTLGIGNGEHCRRRRRRVSRLVFIHYKTVHYKQRAQCLVMNWKEKNQSHFVYTLLLVFFIVFFGDRLHFHYSNWFFFSRISLNASVIPYKFHSNKFKYLFSTWIQLIFFSLFSFGWAVVRFSSVFELLYIIYSSEYWTRCYS